MYDSIFNVHLRKVKQSDINTIFAWRNDPWIVSLGSSQKTVSLNEHKAWFKKVLDKSFHLLFIIISSKDEKMGTLRFDREGESATVTIYLMKEFIGKGRGVQAITLGCDKVFTHWSELISVNAYIRKENIRSIKAFKKAGFKHMESSDEEDCNEEICMQILHSEL